MAVAKPSYFKDLSGIDLRPRQKNKNGVDVVPWAVSYSEAMKYDPDTTYEFLRDRRTVRKTVTRLVDDDGAVREEDVIEYVEEFPYFVTPLGLEVRTRVTINGVTKEMHLPVYNSSYKSMGLEPYTYTTKKGEFTVDAAKIDDVYKSQMRCLAKNFAMFGIALNLWTKEEAPEDVLELEKLRAECMELIQKRGALSKATTVKVGEVCKTVLPDENGDPRICEDNEKLKELKKRLLAIRKIPDEVANKTKTTQKEEK